MKFFDLLLVTNRDTLVVFSSFSDSDGDFNEANVYDILFLDGSPSELYDSFMDKSVVNIVAGDRVIHVFLD